jgi:hypothetical protein
MNRKDAIEQAVNRFLCWRLPADFAPDCGISFDRSGHKYEPVGTNLLTAAQAKQMFLHCFPQGESRLQFENWAHNKGMVLDTAFFADEENNYVNPDTHLAYETWLASQATA